MPDAAGIGLSQEDTTTAEGSEGPVPFLSIFYKEEFQTVLREMRVVGLQL